MPLIIVSKLIAAGRGLAPAVVKRASRVAIDWDMRQKSRFEAADSDGRHLAVFLPRGRTVRGGDVLVGEDGSLIVVEALDQPILVVTAPAGSAPGDAALALAKAAYHLGNRHVPLEVRGDRLVLEPDHVLAELLVRMGLTVATLRGPFEPEAGAYDAGAARHASAGHGHGHEHEAGQVHGHGHHDGCGHDRHEAHDQDPAGVHAHPHEAGR
ncbi:MAG: urease accessory protein UreE [Caldimonas sp.]